MRHTPIDIINMQFPKGVHGYKVEAVRRFLGEMADDLEKVIHERAALLDQVEALRRDVDRFAAMETAIKSAAVTAERNADQTRANAQDEAKNVLRDAGHTASEIIAEATRDEARIRAEIDRLRTERDRFVAEYTARLRAEIELLESAPVPGSLGREIVVQVGSTRDERDNEEHDT